MLGVEGGLLTGRTPGQAAHRCWAQVKKKSEWMIKL